MKVSINNVTLGGNLTADPKLRQTQTGKDVCTFKVAVNRPGEDAGTDFVWVKTWNGSAKACAQYLAEGKAVLVEGSISTSSKKHDDGTYTNYFEVNARRVTFLSPRDQSGEPRPKTLSAGYEEDLVTVEVSSPEPPAEESDIPF